jgi:hypothetical protein
MEHLLLLLRPLAALHCFSTAQKKVAWFCRQESTNTIKIFLLMYISNPIVNDAEKDKNYYFNAPMYLRRKKTFFNE